MYFLQPNANMIDKCIIFSLFPQALRPAPFQPRASFVQLRRGSGRGSDVSNLPPAVCAAHRHALLPHLL